VPARRLLRGGARAGKLARGNTRRARKGALPGARKPGRPRILRGELQFI
jgi:hypothetical protein